MNKQLWIDKNIEINKNTIEETRFASEGNIIVYNQSKNIPNEIRTTNIRSFDYTDYNKENLPQIPLYRPIGVPIGRNAVEIQLNSLALDTMRISKWMFTTGEGVKWVSEQIGLQMSNPKVEKSIFSPLSQNRVYIPAKTLLSVSTAGTGIRFQRSGILGMEYRYEDVININQLGFNDLNNRLIKLGNELNIFNETIGDDEKTVKASIFSNAIKFGLPGNVFSTMSGIGGPQSFFGVGETLIKSAQKIFGPFDRRDFIYQLTSRQYPYGKIVENRLSSNLNDDEKIIQIFKEGYYPDDEKNIEVFPRTWPDASNGFLKISEADLEKQILAIDGILDGQNKKVTNYIIKTYDQLNKITTSVNSFTKRDTSFKDVKGTYLGSTFGSDDKKIKDYYAKYSKYVDPFDQSTDVKGITFKRMDNNSIISLKAYIESFSDTFSPKWNDVNYIGRPDTFRIYSGLTRSINFAFLLVDLDGTGNIWEKINELAQFCSPNYVNERMVSPVLKLTILDLIDEVGYIDNLAISVEQDYPWDLNPKLVGEETKVDIKPMIASIAVTYQSMMDRLPSYNANYYK